MKKKVFVFCVKKIIKVSARELKGIKRQIRPSLGKFLKITLVSDCLILMLFDLLS